MTTFEPAAACARFADLVPLFGDDALDAATAALVRQHLRGCASCRALQDQYTQLDSTLRQRFGLTTVQRRSSEEIMRYIADRAPQPASNTARRVRSPRRRILSGLAAAASILVVLGITGLLFGSRLGFGPGAHLGPARYSFPNTKGSFASISMVSPTEGWALGQILKAPDGQRSLSEVTLYHLLNGAWTPVYVPTSANFGDGGVSGFNGTISMDSATDGWAVAHNFNRFSVLLHYTNGAWTQVTAPDLWTVQALGPKSVWAITGLYDGRPTGLAHYDGSAWTPQALPAAATAQTGGVVAFHMLSDAEGWALAIPNGSTYKMLRFAGGAWTVHSSFSAGEFSDFSAFAMVSSSEGWALGQKIVADTHGNTAHVPRKQLLYHYANGRWSEVPLSLTGLPYVTLQQITMVSPSEGWIVGAEQASYPGATTSDYQQHTILLRYAAGHWAQMLVPQMGTPVDAITGLAFTEDGRGWACGYISNIPAWNTVQDTDVLAQASPLLWSYQDGAWTLFQQQ